MRVKHIEDEVINVLKRQMLITKMGATYQIKANLRGCGKTRVGICTLIFSPILSSNNNTGGAYYSAGTIAATWNTAIKKLGKKLGLGTEKLMNYGIHRHAVLLARAQIPVL